MVSRLFDLFMAGSEIRLFSKAPGMLKIYQVFNLCFLFLDGLMIRSMSFCFTGLHQKHKALAYGNEAGMNGSFHWLLKHILIAAVFSA